MQPGFRLEKQVLQVMCVGTPQGPAKRLLAPLLFEYKWQSELHHAIFDALAAVPADEPAMLRQLLPAKLTRMGFPDIEWDELFAPAGLSREEALAVVHRMLAGS